VACRRQQTNWPMVGNSSNEANSYCNSRACDCLLLLPAVSCASVHVSGSAKALKRMHVSSHRMMHSIQHIRQLPPLPLALCILGQELGALADRLSK
jgi:hypothetical protein